ncbi:hypothetical protein KM043_002577 [Ampulex compressa]|nr:hypothetical protein KM043_002577 [Ampulex compressa]
MSLRSMTGEIRGGGNSVRHEEPANILLGLRLTVKHPPLAPDVLAGSRVINGAKGASGRATSPGTRDPSLGALRSVPTVLEEARTRVRGLPVCVHRRSTHE